MMPIVRRKRSSKRASSLRVRKYCLSSIRSALLQIWQFLNTSTRRVPDLFIGTGATIFNDPEHYPWTLSWTPHYASEGEIYARYILATKPEAKIGILSQNDDLGRDYLLDFRRGLGDKASKMSVSSLTYNVTDPAVDSQIESLKTSGADVF